MNPFAFIRRSPFAFPLACAAAVAMLFISEGSHWKSVASLNELGTMGAARSSIAGLTQGMLDAETGQRGYLLTGRKEYLQPYDNSLRQINESFTFLERYYGQEPQSLTVLGKLQALIRVKLSEIEVTVRLHDEGKAESAIDLVLSDIGNEKMEAIRALSGQLMARETLNLGASRDEINRTLLFSRIGVAALSVISLLALFLYLRQTSALELQQREQQRLVQAERDRLEIEVAQRTAQLTELAHHLQTAREDERNRLARNLHDELGALLTSAKLDAARIRSRLAGTAPEALERLAHLVETLNSSIALGRRIIEDLRPSTLSNLGLVPTLEILARDFAQQSGLQVHSALEPVKLDPTAELVIYRLVQEAITNITKYAKARQVWLNLAAREGSVHVSVRDDGVGFDPAGRRGSALGLVGMRYRVEAEGGTLAVVSSPGQGTLLQVSLPESAATTV